MSKRVSPYLAYDFSRLWIGTRLAVLILRATISLTLFSQVLACCLHYASNDMYFKLQMYFIFNFLIWQNFFLIK
jgi:hypothetical protein